MASSILLVEDDLYLSQGLTELLQKSGYVPCQARNLSQARQSVYSRNFDLLILDVTLPDGDGISFCRELRARGCAAPILFLTARDEEFDIVTGLDAGGNDYVTKPFSIPVLLEKIRVILRRSGEAAESRLHYRDLVVDLDTREAALDGRPLELTAREFELLRTFLAAPGRVFTREMLLSRLWGYDFFGDERVVDSHIKNLRHKLGRDYIETVRGVGYRAAKETR